MGVPSDPLKLDRSKSSRSQEDNKMIGLNFVGGPQSKDNFCHKFCVLSSVPQTTRIIGLWDTPTHQLIYQEREERDIV